MDWRRSTELEFEDINPDVEWKQAGDDQDVVEITLPGFRKEHVRVQVDNNGVLRATGQRLARGGRWVRFRTDLRLPDNCDADGVRARFEDEKLIITLPIVADDAASPTPSPPPYSESAPFPAPPVKGTFVRPEPSTTPPPSVPPRPPPPPVKPSPPAPPSPPRLPPQPPVKDTFIRPEPSLTPPPSVPPRPPPPPVKLSPPAPPSPPRLPPQPSVRGTSVKPEPSPPPTTKQAPPSIPETSERVIDISPPSPPPPPPTIEKGGTKKKDSTLQGAEDGSVGWPSMEKEEKAMEGIVGEEQVREVVNGGLAPGDEEEKRELPSAATTTRELLMNTAAAVVVLVGITLSVWQTLKS